MEKMTKQEIEHKNNLRIKGKFVKVLEEIMKEKYYKGEGVEHRFFGIDKNTQLSDTLAGVLVADKEEYDAHHKRIITESRKCIYRINDQKTI